MLSEKDKNFMIEQVVQQIKKDRPSKFVQWSRSWFNYLTPPCIVAAIWFFAQYTTAAKTLQFDTPNQKETVVNHVKNAPDPVLLDMLKKHTTDPGVHMPKDKQDSVYVTREEYQELIKNHAIDMYNMKRAQDRVLESLQEMSKDIRAINYKLD